MQWLSLTDTITVNYRGIPLRLPHPVRFALHKLVVADRRRDSEKAEKDRAQAVLVLQAVREAGNAKQIAEIHASLPAKWQRVIEGSLGKCAEPEAIQLLNNA